ncbi:hypothetical protein DSO57_1004640 [Entomophthora muscae]|uniref:Uncharacterized protein n=1 Tax=Entomophthora muscae TaxID=34485 RepID=A0ACC2SKZ9_9FUNG|nr:hypothetical protein DSO57_1004640 [Entomophthora muscae]
MYTSMISLSLLLVLAPLAAADFDYVVVGSGPGGGTLATELALKGFKTLLIEAGPEYFQANQSTPVFHSKSAEDPATTFDFDVKHYDNSKTYFYPRAGVLGGCAVHHAMISVYPNSRDFKLMQSITGDDKWSEENMRSYFQKMEGNQYLNKSRNPDHGFDGWLKTSFLNSISRPILDQNLGNYLQAVVGNPRIDLNSRDSDGLMTDREANAFIPLAVDKTTATRVNFPAYIRSVAKNHPLTIWTDTFVTKVLFNGTTAVGVEYKKGTYLYKASPLSTDANRSGATLGSVMANKEIIISGGTFNTPQILMLSGIGDREHLEEFNISVVSHVPGVGRNMMDRYEVPMVLQYGQKFKHLTECKFTPTADDPCYHAYLKERKNSYTANGMISGHSRKSNPSLGEPDLFTLSSLTDFHGYFRGYSNLVAEHTDHSTRIILKAHTSNTNGQIKLLSSNPFDVPDIHFHSFSDGDSDLNILVDAVKADREFLKKTILVPHKEVHPGSNVQTDEQIRDYIKETAWGHHACCTAKMGTSDDANAVVDAKFRVRGVKNLRVVDMSIFPKIPGYFPSVYIHMMAMKAADDMTS